MKKKEAKTGRTIWNGWMAFGRLSITLCSQKFAKEQKAKVFTCARIRNGNSYSHTKKKSLEWITQQTGVQSIVEHLTRQKWSWTRHVMRTTYDLWTKGVPEWRPIERQRKAGRPPMPWVDNSR